MSRLSRLLVPTLLLIPACGDSGHDTAATTMLTTVSASASQTDGADDTATPDPDTTAAPTSTAPQTGADTSTSTPDATTTDVTTGSADPSTTTTTTGVDPSTTTDTADASTSSTDATTTAPTICGDGVQDPGETCDDGLTADCATTHDGGAGACVPAGECSPGYILSNTDCVIELMTAHVHIMVDNFCNMQVDPPEFDVLPGQKLRLEYHNHSVDYPVDVWMHYNGGFLDLQPGATWKEQYEHCFGPNPSEGWADITTACSEYQLPIHCL